MLFELLYQLNVHVPIYVLKLDESFFLPLLKLFNVAPDKSISTD